MGIRSLRAGFLFVAAAASFMVLASRGADAGDGDVVREIERRGTVRCGISFNPGFAANDSAGRPVGFMVDLCRSLAAAVLGRADAIEVRNLFKPQEFAAVASGEVDVSFAQTTWTLGRDAGEAVDFGPPVFHDEQAIAVWRLADGRSPLDGPDAAVCVPAGSTSHVALEETMARTGKSWRVMIKSTWPDALQAFIGRECAALMIDRARLLTALPRLGGPKETPDLLPAPIPSREPIAPLVSNADHLWLSAVRWTMFALIYAEDAGVTAENAGSRRQSGGSEVQRMLNGIPEASKRMGLRTDWAFQAITQVGNYGEIFERNLGAGSPFGLERGPNRPWTRGGLLYAPVFQ